MRKIAVLLLISGLAGCVTTYQAEGFSGGFSETQLDKNVFRVSFRGNGFTRPDRAEELALLRSAELTLLNGFTHFVIVDGRSTIDQQAMTTPTQTTTTGTVSRVGNTAYVNAQTQTFGGQTTIVTKPSTTNTIVCFKGKPEGVALAYDAKFLYESLAKKYGITAPAPAPATAP